MVKSNTRALAFYQKHGWRVHREFPHEKFGHAMFEMTLDVTEPLLQK